MKGNLTSKEAVPMNEPPKCSIPGGFAGTCCVPIPSPALKDSGQSSANRGKLGMRLQLQYLDGVVAALDKAIYGVIFSHSDDQGGQQA